MKEKWILTIKYGSYNELTFEFDFWGDFADFLNVATECAKGDYEFIVKRICKAVTENDACETLLEGGEVYETV